MLTHMQAIHQMGERLAVIIERDRTLTGAQITSIILTAAQTIDTIYGTERPSYAALKRRIESQLGDNSNIRKYANRMQGATA